MPTIRPCPLPEGALLDRYRRTGAYTDCYRAAIARRVSLPAFIEAFYTGPLFKTERLILAVLLSKPSSDDQVRRLAAAETDRFSAWRVESRTADQVLLSDVFGHTRSWLMCAGDPEGSAATHVYFGSAVVPRIDPASGRSSFGVAFHLLGGFHRLYSRALLRQAVSRLTRNRTNGGLPCT